MQKEEYQQEVVCDNYNLQSLLFTSPPLSNQLSHWIIYCICVHCAPTLHCSITKAIHIIRWHGKKETSQELRMLSSVAINCQVTKIVMNSGSQLSVL